MVMGPKCGFSDVYNSAKGEARGISLNISNMVLW